MFAINSEVACATAPHTELAFDDVCQIVHDVFGAMFGWEIEAAEVSDVTGSRMNGCVHITGAWQGAIVVETTRQFGLSAAAITFEIRDDCVTAADVNDVLAETANMIGGNIKSLLPGPSALSLPAVAEGSDFLLSLPQTRVVLQAGFRCGGEVFRVSVCAKRDARSRVPSESDRD